jgi:hypothetical protein
MGGVRKQDGEAITEGRRAMPEVQLQRGELPITNDNFGGVEKGLKASPNIFPDWST